MASIRETPITEFVFWPAERTDAYVLPTLTRATTLYGTPTTIRCKVNGNPPTRPQLAFATDEVQLTQRKENLYCMPDEETWEAFLDELATLQDALTALKAEVSTLQLYSKRRDELERQNIKTNPVCRSAIQIWPIDKRFYSAFEPWAISSIRRGRVEGHSFHNLRLADSSSSMANSIYEWHCCWTEADWQRVNAAHTAAAEAYTVVAARVQALGKYNTAAKDGRYRALQRKGESVAVGLFAPETKKKTRKQKVAA